MTIIYEIILENGRDSTYRFLDMGIAHQYMMQLMKNSMAFSFYERDVKSGSTAHQSILSKQDILHELATGKLPFDTRVPKTNASEAKVEETKPKEETKLKKSKAKESKSEESKAEESKAEESKAEETKENETKAEETKEKETKEKETKEKETKEKETKEKETKEKETKEKETKEKETKEKETKAKKSKAKETKAEALNQTAPTAAPTTIFESNTPTGCIYKMMRGERKGESCNKPCSKDSTFCKTHK